MIDVTDSLARTADWLLANWSNNGAPLHPGGEPNLLPTCFAVVAAELLGVLPDKQSSPAREALDAIAAAQDEQSGFFADREILRKDSSSHSVGYIRMQHTYFALHALDALGERHAHGIQLAERFRSHDYLVGWLDGGPWNNPWLHSNNIMFALSFLEQEHRRTGDDDLLRAFDKILDYLDQRQDAASGLWQPDGGRDDPNAVFAAYHFFPFYFWRGRRPRFVEAIIDTTLGIQAPNGYFFRPRGGACEDLDAVHTLVMMSMVSEHRAEEVRASLLKHARVLLGDQQPDGGFLNYSQKGERREKRLIRATGLDRRLLRRSLIKRDWTYSGWRPLRCPVERSDMWSAWFRPLSLRLIAERYAGSAPEPRPGGYRSSPGLGWHDPEAIRNSA